MHEQRARLLHRTFGGTRVPQLAAVLAIVAAGCHEVTKGRAFERRVYISVVPTIAAEPSPGVATQTGGTLGNLHIRVTQDGAAPYNTVVAFPAGAASAEISFAAPVITTNSMIEVSFELQIDAQPRYTGTVTVPIQDGAPTTPPPVLLSYVGPVQSVQMPTDTVRATELDTLPLAATIIGTAGYPVTGKTVTYTSSTPAVATVSSNGTLIARQAGITTITATSEGRSASATLRVSGLFASLAPGGGFTCGLTARGKVYCWGALTNDGTQFYSRPTALPGALVFSSLRGGQFHACGVTTGAIGYCWGSNFSGQLGDGTLTLRSLPTLVAGGLMFSDIAPGVQHSCGLTVNGSIHCWGWNINGSLGDGTTTDHLTPVAVGGGLSFARVITGGYHSCALTASGAAFCWGQNFVGQLGNGSTDNAPFPTPVAGGLTFAHLTSGIANQVTCGLASGAIFCWGWNDRGQLGDGSLLNQSVPVAVTGGANFIGVGTGQTHACGWTPLNVFCWGANESGQLGNGATSDSPVPAPVAGAAGFRSVAPGGAHTCGLDQFGAAFCWGNNNVGQLGDGSNTPRLTPVRVLLPLN